MRGIVRPFTIVLVLLAVSGSLAAVWIQPSAASVSSWSATTNYPVGIEGQSCVVSSGFVYCVGGGTWSGGALILTAAVYYASLSSSGVGSWSPTTSYPTPIFGQSCVVNSGFAYCIGGHLQNGSADAVYFAALSSNGVGSWSITTNYPTTVSDQSCVADSGFVYCIGGLDPSTNNAAVYFAALSSGGVGSWSATTNYPTTIYDQGCFANSGFVYCVGGVAGGGPGGLTNTNAVYFAALSSSGVGSWSATTKVPTDYHLGRTCLVDSDFVYCIGYFASAADAVYFAPLFSGGVGVWSATTNYPTPISGQSCVADSGFGIVYCIGGTTSATCNCATNAVYFGQFVTEGLSRTGISCSPSMIAYNQPSQCTATVTDSSATPTPPTGNVTFSITPYTPGHFTPSNTCTLVPTGPSTASCAVNITYPAPNPCCIPPSEGSQPVTGTYSGDSTHHASSGTTTITVTRRSTSTMVSCSKLKSNAVCTVNVIDASPATPTRLTGTVAFSTTGTGGFSSCVMSTNGSTATCTVNYVPGKGKAMIITITATYSGDQDHLGSSGSTTIKSS